MMDMEDDDEEINLEPDQNEQAIQQLVQMQQMAQEQLTQVVQQIGALQAQVAQALTQALSQVAQSNQMVAQAMQAMCAPKRRVAIRDGEGRITESRDMPI